MSKYKEIKGFKVQTLASDTAASVAATGSWASGTSMPSASGGRGMAGAYHSSIAYGGTGSPPTAAQGKTEYFDGTSWSEKSDLNTARFMGCPAKQGTQTAALFAAGSSGSDNANVESWNGSSWSEVNDVPTAKHSYADGLGTQTAALAVGAGPPNRAIVSSWDGSNWTDVAELNTGRYFNSCSGSQTAGLCFAGDVDNTFTANTESWNGSSWTELNNLNTVRATGGGAGTQTSALMMTGNTAPGPLVANVEVWDGTSWTEVADISTARNRPGSTGANSTAAIVAGGYAPSIVANVEEWTTTPAADFTKINLGQVYYNSGSNAFKVTAQSVPTTSWSSGGNLNVAKQGVFAYGPTGSAAGSVGGSPSPTSATHEQYNGTAWTEVGDLNTGRYAESRTGSGTQTAALICSGGDVSAITETYNGSSWTEVADLNTTRRASGGLGSQTATLNVGGRNPPAGDYALTEEWNGSAWTEIGDINTARYSLGGIGTTTDAIVVSGYITSPGYTKICEKWNGSSWTEVGDLNTIHTNSGAGSAGSNTDALVYGGSTGPSRTANTELFNGTSWTELNNLSTAVNANSGNGTSLNALNFGGNNGSTQVTTTEEWNAATANKTITVS